METSTCRTSQEPQLPRIGLYNGACPALRRAAILEVCAEPQKTISDPVDLAQQVRPRLQAPELRLRLGRPVILF